MKRKWLTVVLIIVFVIGVGIMLYPSIANLWNSHIQQERIADYNDSVDNLGFGSEEYTYELEKAIAYNNTLWPTDAPENFAFLKDDDPTPEYLDCLNFANDGIMGWVEVPKINVEIPIYHATPDNELLNGAGHLEGTSLPVGGESTHSVIAAHRGLPGARLFTDLDRMEISDHFYIHVLDETLCYEIDQIKTVGSDDVSDLVIEEDEDLCTLLTCTPYGVNTDRLLVRGHRIPLEEATADEPMSFQLNTQNILLIIGIAVAIIGILLLVFGGRKKKRKPSDAEEGGNESKD